MQYLSNRKEFLNKSIKKINEFKTYDNYELINESDSGPFANDIPWGDSLLGRLINRTMRNAKIGANLVRIKGVIRRLKDAFDDIIDNYGMENLSEEEKKEVDKLLVFTFLENLKEAVDEGYKVIVIKNLTKSAIEEVKNHEDFEGKNELISQLEEFLEFLKQFKDDEGEDDKSISEEEGEGEDKGDENKEGSSSDKKSAETLYPVMVKNLKALGLVLSNYKNVKIVGTTTKTQSSATVRTYTTKEGDTVDKIVANTDINFKKFTADILRQKNQKVLTPFPKNDQTLKPGLLLVMEKSMILEAVPGNNNLPGGSQDRGNIKSGEDHLTQAFTKLKKDIEVLISAKEKGIGVDVNFIKDITSKAVDSNTKNQIKSLYVEINRYLVGDKKATIQEKDPLYKESLEVITDKNKRVVVAEKMARFTKRALQFDKEGLYGGLGDLTKPLKDYVDSIKQIMQMSPVEPKKEEPKKEEVKKESLLRYNSFLLIKEAEEGQGEEDRLASEPSKETTSQKIKDYFYKNIDIKKYTMEKTEVEKVKKNFDAKAKNNKDSLILNGLDPILEIVKIFNKAYKIHTTPVIPNVGTSDGRVSASTMAQYTCFGQGTRMNAGMSGGPYRNNAMFNQWEDAVLNIMRDRKYQPIFNVSTKLKVGNEYIEKAGANLRKFMTDMLDTEELYSKGTDGKGQQRVFLDKYFGYKEGDEGKVTKDIYYDEGDQKQNFQVSEEMPKEKTLEFSKAPIKFESGDQLEKTFFAVKEKGEDKYTYFFIQSVAGDVAYLVFSNTFYFFKKYILESGTLAKISKGELSRLFDDKSNKDSEQYKLKATKIKIENLIDNNGNFKLTGNNYEIEYITRYDAKMNNPNTKPTKSTEPEKLSVEGCYTLSQLTKDVETAENKERFKLDKKIGTQITNQGGFMNWDGINLTQMKKL